MKQKMKVEFIESYIKGVNGSADYQWNDNHGELIRCKDCLFAEKWNRGCYCLREIGRPNDPVHDPNWYCADGERKTK